MKKNIIVVWKWGNTMVKRNSLDLMCSEVLKILEYCPKSDVAKIPVKLIEFLENNALPNHEVEIDPDKTIFEQNVNEKTLVMMFIIFSNYWATAEEKKEFNRILNENQMKLDDLKLNEKSEYEKLFQKPMNNEETYISKCENSDETLMVEYEETFIKKIVRVIKKIFKPI